MRALVFCFIMKWVMPHMRFDELKGIVRSNPDIIGGTVVFVDTSFPPPFIKTNPPRRPRSQQTAPKNVLSYKYVDPFPREYIGRSEFE
jgi:hypothetical protein